MQLHMQLPCLAAAAQPLAVSEKHATISKSLRIPTTLLYWLIPPLACRLLTKDFWYPAVALFTAALVAPRFRAELRSPSAYEFLEQRFSLTARLYAAAVYAGVHKGGSGKHVHPKGLPANSHLHVTAPDFSCSVLNTDDRSAVKPCSLSAVEALHRALPGQHPRLFIAGEAGPIMLHTPAAKGPAMIVACHHAAWTSLHPCLVSLHVPAMLPTCGTLC